MPHVFVVGVRQTHQPAWLTAPNDMAVNREQRRSYCHVFVESEYLKKCAVRQWILHVSYFDVLFFSHPYRFTFCLLFSVILLQYVTWWERYRSLELALVPDAVVWWWRWRIPTRKSTEVAQTKKIIASTDSIKCFTQRINDRILAHT